VDLVTTLPWDWVVLTGAGISPNSMLGRYIALLALLKLGRMYRIVIMFYNISYNLNFGLLSLTLMRNFTVRCWCSFRVQGRPGCSSVP
jgi:hypothetical protein